MEFQAFTKSIDYLTNQEIPIIVNNITWLALPKKSLLTCNAKSVKLWSIKEKQFTRTESAREQLQKEGYLKIPETHAL